MNVVPRDAWEVVVHHMGDAVHVNAPRSDIGRHEDAHRADLKSTGLAGAGFGTGWNEAWPSGSRGLFQSPGNPVRTMRFIGRKPTMFGPDPEEGGAEGRI